MFGRVVAEDALFARWLLASALPAILAGCSQREIAAEPPFELGRPVAALAAAPSKPPAIRPSPGRLTAPRLRSIRFERDRWIADLTAPSSGRAELLFATRQHPLAHRGPVVCRRLAELIAPASVRQTTLEILPLGEVMRAAPDEPRRRKQLGQTLRVLADGRVRGALIAVPPDGFVPVDLTDELEGSAVFRWESALVRREMPERSLHDGLSAYQAVLVVDHLVQNQSRKSLFVGEGGTRVVAGEGSDAFTTQPVEGALAAPLTRLARHVSYSTSLVERLRALDRERLVKAFGTDLGGEMLVTPKEIDQILERKRGLLKLVDRLVKARGREKALCLP